MVPQNSFDVVQGIALSQLLVVLIDDEGLVFALPISFDHHRRDGILDLR